jgi:tetratricopeptide (TPR) repeat protein
VETHHLTRDQFRSLANAEEGWEAAGAAAAHLALCPACRELLARLPEDISVIVRQKLVQAAPEKRYSVLDYRQVLRRAGEKFLEEEALAERARASARRLFEQLEAYPAVRRRLVAANLKRFQVWSLAELLLEESRNAWTSDPQLAEARALIACDIAEGLRARGYREILLNDLRAEAWCYLGNASRIRGRLEAAENAFLRAETFLENGSGEVEDLAQLLDLKGSLLRDQGRFEEAGAVLDQVIDCHRSLGDASRVGRGLISKAKLLREWQRVEEGVALLREAEPLLDPAREPGLMLNLKINLMTYLLLLGRPEEAQQQLSAVKQLTRSLGGRLERLRSLWVEGRLRYALGQEALGEELLHSAHDGFLRAGVAYEAASVALDLAAVYLDQGRSNDVRELAERVEVYAVLASSNAEREAVEVLTGLAAPADVTKALLEQVTRRFQSLPSRTRFAEDFGP